MKATSYELLNKLARRRTQLVPIRILTSYWQTRLPNIFNSPFGFLSPKDYWIIWLSNLMKSLKIPKGQSESVYRYVNGQKKKYKRTNNDLGLQNYVSTTIIELRTICKLRWLFGLFTVPFHYRTGQIMT